MIKNLLSILFVSLVFLPHAYAAPTFSHPVLQKAYEQVNIRIDRQTDNIILDEGSKKGVEQKKAELSRILVSIDGAFRAHNKTELKKQAKLFRDTYKETIAFLQSVRNGTVLPNTHKNIPRTPENSGSIKNVTDITYYADSFEWGKTANGNLFSQSYFSAAACEIPFNTLIQVGKEDTAVVVKVNDRPNCTKHPNLTDLTTTAFRTIGRISSGRIPGTTNVLGMVPKNYTKRILRTDAFKDLWIELDGNIPNTYLKNETIRIAGRELSGKEYTILYLKSPSGKDITLGTKKWPDGRFEYDYPLEETGTYQMVVSSWLGFNTGTIIDIIVLEDSLFSSKRLVPSTKKEADLGELEVERRELPDMTSNYIFRFSPENFHTVTIRSDKETFIYRGFWSIAIRGDAMKSVDMGKAVSIQVDAQKSSTAFSHDTYTTPVTVFKKTMMLVPGHREERNENITATVENGSILIRGIVKKGKQVKSDIMITLPDGNVEKHTFDTQSIDTDGYMKREKVFEKTIPLKRKGAYLVEVNYDNGFAAYNGPIVYGDFLPIYPNDYDNVQKKIDNTDRSVVTIESLKFVNDLRSKTGKSALSLDDTLNSLATIKANDMAKYNNISHVDSYGDKINDTAKRNGIRIAGGVGENVAGGNIHYKVFLIGLANSGGHRANMLDPWKKMGVGYTVKDGQAYYVQVFGE